MKKYSYFLLFVGLTTLAQNKPIFGVNIGGTFSNIRGNEGADQHQYDLNFLVGGSIEIPLNERLSFLGNVNYERNTSKRTSLVFFSDPFDPVIIEEEADVQNRLEFLTIPINLKYYLNPQKSWYVNGGPFLGIFLNSNSKIDGENTDDDFNSLMKSVNFGLNLGFGKQFQINEKYRLNLEIRHNYGLSNISDVPVMGDGTLKTNSFNLIANWQFGL